MLQTKKMPDKVLIIDGLNFIYRSYIKFDQSDEYTIVFNFFRSLRVLIEKFSPTKCFFVLDGYPKHRYDLYPEYKANRLIKSASKEEIKNAVYQQKDLIITLLQCLPIAVVIAKNFEADDVISTLVENLKEEELLIVSGDSDYIQLLQKNINNLKLYNPIKKEFIEAPSYHYLVKKCLFGDASDNIKGIVSEKEAIELASNPKLLEHFFQNIENKENFNLNKSLIELNSISFSEIIFLDSNINFEFLKQEFERMKFNSLITDKYWTRFVNTFKILS